MTIVISNTVALNGGDAAILKALVGLLRKEFGQDTRIVVFDSHPEVASRYYPDLEFRKMLYDRAAWAPNILNKPLGAVNAGRVRAAAKLMARGLDALARPMLTVEEFRDLDLYRNAELIVSTGGTYLVEHYHLHRRLFDFDICLGFNAPLMFFTQSLGPFAKKKNREAFQKIFNHARLVLLRDARSRGHLVDIGVKPSHLHVVPDGAFALADEDRLRAAMARTFPKQSARVVVSVRYWHHFTGDNDEGMRKYKESVGQAVSHLVRDYGATVSFVSTCQGIEEYWTDDAAVAADIMAQLPADVRDAVSIDEKFHSPEELVDLLAEQDLIIATRMHMAILSLIAGTPVLPIAYEFKTQELFENLGNGEWVADINAMNPGAFSAKLDAFVAALPETREALFESVIREADAARSAGPLIGEASSN